MKIVATRKGSVVEEVDHTNTNKHNDPVLYSKLHYNMVTTPNTLTTSSSSPTLTDDSEDVSLDDEINVEDDDVTNDVVEVVTSNDVDLDKPISIMTDKHLNEMNTTHLPLTVPTITTTMPKRPSLIHSIEESRKARLYRQQDAVPFNTVDDTLLTTQRDVEHTPYEDIALLSSQTQQQQELATMVPKLTVRFSTITIRDYPRSIGDNPASSCGPSISMGWEHESEVSVPIDAYEENRGPRRRGREMIIPVQLREEILRNAGYSRAEIMKCTRDINIARGQRRRTYDTLHLQSIQLLTERITRKAWNVLTLGEHKRKERAILQEFSHGKIGGEMSPAVPFQPTSSSNNIKGILSVTSMQERSSPTTTSTSTSTITSNDHDDESSSSLI
jgi:hypothetical protein